MAKYDIVLLGKPGETGLVKSEILTLCDMLLTEEIYPVEIGNINGTSSAMGFITTSAAEKLQYEYDQSSDLGKFVSNVLNDTTLESEFGIYEFEGLKIWLGCNLLEDDFSKYMNPPITDETSPAKTMFASVAIYTGDGSVNAVLFDTEEAAKTDCKKQFENSLSEGIQSGDIDPNMESVWHDDEMYGAVYWDDMNTSTFEVKEFTLHESSDEKSNETMIIPTPAGEIRVYKSKVSERPGCHVMLSPKGYNDEIDVVTVLAEENAPENLGIYVYDNPSEEDYQSHTTLERNEVVQSINW